MASGLSRTYLNSLTHAQLGLLTRNCSARVIVPATYRRTYATATVVAKNKAKSIRKTSATPDSTQKVSAKTRTKFLASGPVAKAAAKDVFTPAEKPKAATEQEQIEQLDQILAFSQFMPTADVWGQKVDTLDVTIPYSVISRGRTSSIGVVWEQFWRNRHNDLKNATSMAALASHNALPGVSTGNDGFFKKLFTWPIHTFTAKSTKPTSWLAQTRSLALDTYTQLNVAMAKNDIKEIKRLTTDAFLTDTLAGQKKRSSTLNYVWRLHREVNPTQIVSIRVTEGYLAAEDPKFGNRLMVHALVKFDTEQSLEIYDRRGKPMHKLATDIEAKEGSFSAERQRVVQYLVLEKRMWYDGPWVVRDQIWEVNN